MTGPDRWLERARGTTRALAKKMREHYLATPFRVVPWEEIADKVVATWGAAFAREAFNEGLEKAAKMLDRRWDALGAAAAIRAAKEPTP